MDYPELLRLNRLYVMASGINQAILRTSEPLELYAAACRIAVEGGMSLAWVGFAQAEGDWVKIVARDGKDSDYLDEVRVSLRQGPMGNGPTGKAFRSGGYCVCNDTAADPDFEPWREAALRRGYRSSAGFALNAGGRPVGVFCVYADQPGYFAEEEVRLLISLADNLSFSIDARLQAEALRASEQQQVALAAEVARERARLLEAQRVAKIGSWETDLETFDVLWSPQTHLIFETDPEEFHPTHQGFLARVHPEDRRRVADAFENSLEQMDPCSIEHRVLVGEGRVKVVEERWQVYFNSAGVAERALGTCLDISERKRVEAESVRAAEALRASMEEFRHLAETIPQIVWTARADGGNSYINKLWIEYTGLDAQESADSEWSRAIHPQDRERVLRAWHLALRTAGNYVVESRLRRADGEYRWWLIRGQPVCDENGKLFKWLGTCTDVHDLKVANRALQMLSHCDEAMVRAESEQGLLQAICDVAVSKGGYAMAWVGYRREGESRKIEPQASAGHESGYLKEVEILWDENLPAGRGPSGRVIREGKVVSVSDLSHDPRFAPWREAAGARGYRSMVCLPLNDENGTFGVFSLYRDELATVGPDETRLLQEMADDLAYGIVTLRARAERQRLQDAVLAIARGVSASVGAEFFTQLTLHLVEAVGADAGFIALLTPPENRSARTLAAVVNGKRVPNFDYSLAGTPCEAVVGGPVCVYERDVCRLFPGDRKLSELAMQAYVGSALVNASGECVGLLIVLFANPIRQSDFLVSAIQIFAARAASELERQQTDVRVREQASLLDQAQDAIVVRDLDQRITYWNKGAERLYGWTAEQAQGSRLDQLLGVDEAAVGAAQAAVLAHGEWQGELQKTSRLGHRLTVSCRWTLVRHNASILSIDTDITERKRLEEQFLRAQRLESIGTLAGGIAHDLNNALSPILMALELLRMQFPEPDSRELVDAISASAERSAEMVRQVLAFARGVEGERVAVCVGGLVKDVAKIANDTFLKSIQVSTVVAPDLWPVLGDATQIHQVLMNLCVNARDAMDQGGCLQLSAENHPMEDGPYLLLRVQDSGKGIPNDLLEKIFDPFFTTKEVGKGTGLGLSTSAAIVKSHGGFLRVHSQLGAGSTFEVYLPARPGHSSGERDLVPVEMPRGQGELILVVDDEDSVRRITRRTLEIFGYRVLLAGDGAEALALFQARRSEIGVVLTDMMMPVMDGPALIEALRRIDPDVRIMGASGLAAQGTSSPAARLGLKHFLIKPYKTELLLKALRELLRPAPD